MTKAEETPQSPAPQEEEEIATPSRSASRRIAFALMAAAGVVLVVLGVAYQPFGNEASYGSKQQVGQPQASHANEQKKQVEFTIDSATGKVEENHGNELRQLLSLVEQERNQARGQRHERQLSSKSGSGSSKSSKGKGKGSKGSKKASEMPSTAPTITAGPSVSDEPSVNPSSTPSLGPSISNEPTSPTVSPAPSNEPTGSKGSKGKGKGSKGSSSSSGSGKSRRDRDRQLRDFVDEVEKPFKTGKLET